MTQPLPERTRITLDRLRGELLGERNEQGHWVGALSPSALSTATAVSAMSAVILHSQGERRRKGDSANQQLVSCVEKGISYLSTQQNADGGYGDTDRSHSNIATSYLVLAARSLAEQSIGLASNEESQQRLKAYLSNAGGLQALRARYGTDKTFVVPILTNMAIAGLVPWNEVAALPFEAAVFPQSMYRLMQMPVVSYAIPALVAIGQARHFLGPKAIIPLRWIRSVSVKRTMDVLEKMQPESGGYLEATPLTSFVVMSLAATSRADASVSRLGLKFLLDSMDDQGRWPIDTNLATWVTSLSIHALRCDPADDRSWASDQLGRWHLSCQHRRRHPFTGAEPGGWGWSDLSGAVPDSDDTPAAILAITQIRDSLPDGLADQSVQAVSEGKRWLQKLQNRDGGWPTFCRGWGKLPFDRSSNDLTAHALRALDANGGDANGGDANGDNANGGDANGDNANGDNADTQRQKRKGREFLERSQQADGSWLPLWFGNQDRSDESNPIYGTSRVLLAAAAGHLSTASAVQGCEYLVQAQNQDGGWGGGPSVQKWLKRSIGQDFDIESSVEETALAVEALSTVLLARRNFPRGRGVRSDQDPSNPSIRMAQRNHSVDGGTEAFKQAIIRGVEFLLRSVDEERHRVPWPIGFYFAKLWYHERLYPLVFAVAALGKFLRLEADQYDPNWPR